MSLLWSIPGANIRACQGVMCGTVQRFTKTACYTDFFPLFLMLSIHEAHYSVLMLYRFFLSDASPLGSSCPALSSLLILWGFLCCCMGRGCGQQEKKMARRYPWEAIRILWPAIHYHRLWAWVGRGSTLQSLIEVSMGRCLYSLDFSWPSVMDPRTVSRTTCQSTKPSSLHTSKRAGRLNRGQIHKKDCAYYAEEAGV